jgi:uncharacterized membrane protein
MTKFKAKYVVFSVIAVMMGYVLYHNERFLVEPSNPIWAHYEPFKWWLLPHGIFGACTLLLAPFQFSERLRKRFTRGHRIVGRIYVIGALCLAPLGVYIQYYQERLGSPRSFSVLSVVDAVMLITTTAIAFLFAYRRKIKEHQQWVTRSYAVAFVFITGRFVLGVTGWELLSVEIAQAVIWSCLALSVPIADVINNWKEIRALFKATTRARALPHNLPEPVVETI